MIWRCEVKNGTVGWTKVEIVGDDFKSEFSRRFGSMEYKNVEQFDYIKNEWVRVIE